MGFVNPKRAFREHFPSADTEKLSCSADGKWPRTALGGLINPPEMLGICQSQASISGTLSIY
ncbi:hypothetical protein QUF80_03320 [Desulfococcaceae bacterium HSG8]|nr:hypothetical protein [Desulfococcaceae bacterium HSG8]